MSALLDGPEEVTRKLVWGVTSRCAQHNTTICTVKSHNV
jgi:hypothetical protein